MNKTLSIGLAGYSFIIEEHAYIKLSDYLKALRNSLEQEEAEEVMHDIEIRMVEIFNESLGKREVVNDSDVERVIGLIGKPEEIEEQEESYYSNKKNAKPNTSQNAVQKQLFRDPEKRKIAGVCAGLSHYIGMDTGLMRAIWLGIAILGIFTAAVSTTLIVFLYIILWIVLPKAITATDYLRMKGKPMNFGNLKEESTKIIQFANDSSQKVGEIYTENKKYINQAGNGIVNVFRYILGAIFAILALSLLIGSFAIFGLYDNTNVGFMGNIGFFLKDQNMGFVAIGFAFLSAFIPGLIFTILSFKLFSPRTKFKSIGYVFGGLILLWIILLGFIGYSAVQEGNLYTGYNEDIENIAINTKSDTLYVDLNKIQVPENYNSYWNDIYSDGKTIYKYNHVYVNVNRDEAIKEPNLEIKKTAKGFNAPLHITLPITISENRLAIPNFMKYDFKNRLRNYRVEYTLNVPKNMKVIATNKRGFHVSDEDEGSVAKVIKNSASVTYDSDNKDSIEINGKNYHIDRAEDILDSLDIEFDFNTIKNSNNTVIEFKNNKIKVKTE